jgi:hypothetical protein
MTALSDLIMRNADSKPLSEILHQAEQWSKKALEIATQHSSSNVGHHPNCDVVLAVAAYNIGIIKSVRRSVHFLVDIHVQTCFFVR